MNLVEYLNRLTNNGTKCALPTEIFKQQTEEQSVGDGAGGRSGITVVRFVSESLSNEKRDFRLLQQITLRALNTKCDNASIFRLWKALFVLVPKDFRNGLYDELKSDFKDWLLMFVDTICTELSNKMLTERNIPGARYWLTTLQTRMDAWQKSVNVEASDAGTDKQLSIHIAGF